MLNCVPPSKPAAPVSNSLSSLPPLSLPLFGLLLRPPSLLSRRSRSFPSLRRSLSSLSPLSRLPLSRSRPSCRSDRLSRRLSLDRERERCLRRGGGDVAELGDILKDFGLEMVANRGKASEGYVIGAKGCHGI